MDQKAARAAVVALAKVDEALDEVLYRPLVVRAFRWLPRWWLCDLAKLSMRLDDRWHTGWWNDAWKVPGAPCAACRRRASIHVIDHPDGSEVRLCGWCHIGGPVLDEADLKRELDAAATDSVSWRWRSRRR
jgi:hypothetical protein